MFSASVKKRQGYFPTYTSLKAATFQLAPAEGYLGLQLKTTTHR